MEDWGDRIDAYDLIVALSPAAMRQAQEYTRYHAIDVEYWPIFDPTGLGEGREAKLAAYRQARDQIEAPHPRPLRPAGRGRGGRPRLIPTALPDDRSAECDDRSSSDRSGLRPRVPADKAGCPADTRPGRRPERPRGRSGRRPNPAGGTLTERDQRKAAVPPQEFRPSGRWYDPASAVAFGESARAARAPGSAARTGRLRRRSSGRRRAHPELPRPRRREAKVGAGVFCQPHSARRR